MKSILLETGYTHFDNQINFPCHCVWITFLQRGLSILRWNGFSTSDLLVGFPRSRRVFLPARAGIIKLSDRAVFEEIFSSVSKHAELNREREISQNFTADGKVRREEKGNVKRHVHFKHITRHLFLGFLAFASGKFDPSN